MERAYLEIIFLCGIVLLLILLLPYFQFFIDKKHLEYFNKKERHYLIALAFVFLLLPIIYIFSTWFSWFDYSLPKWYALPAALLYFFGLWMLFRTYSDLGSSWSLSINLNEDHHLITSGLYNWVRHPMYAGLGAIAIAQILMLQNWLVGPAFLLVAIPFYLYRVKLEEKILISHFGIPYIDYRKNTNALIPKIKQIDFKNFGARLKLLIPKKRNNASKGL